MKRQLVRSLLVPVAVCLAAACGGAAQTGPTGDPPSGDPIRDVEGEDLLQRGLALANNGDFVRSEQYLAAALARGTDPRRVLPPLMRVCVLASRLRAGIEYAQPYLQRHPDEWSLRHLVATLHLAIGDRDRARSELERVVREQPDQPTPHWTLALLLRDELQQPALARAHLERYLQLAPEGEHAGDARAALAEPPPAPLPTEPNPNPPSRMTPPPAPTATP